MKKLPHEKLREIAPRISKSGGDDWGIDELREVMNVACYSTYQSDLKNTVLAIADEIEKYYIPRPRYEDGEPVQFGKEFVDCNGHNQTLSSLTYTKGGHGYVSLNGWTKQRIDEPAKRPEPDSLEKLRDDMAEYKSDTHFAELKTEHTFGEFINRLTALMERDA
ncbi:MAG: hypothetical protein Q3X42_00515 [Eggerthellaceae bacterium]|nr:hypothetical protein [Eggerthellaceae bacterium]